MKDTILIDGRIYISSRRAAEMSKYSNDYIGQLCRGGKVAAKMMGRVWFVDRDSLFGHKKAAEEVLSGKVERTESRYQNSSKDVSSNLADKKSTGTRKSSYSGRRIFTAAVMSVVLVAGAYAVTSSGIFSSNNADAQTASASGVFSWIGNIFGSIFSHHDTAVASNQSNVPANTDSSSTNIPSWNGMAVAPSTGASDAQTKQRIQSSFSDNVTVTPDATGNAGVIKPVFKKTNGDDFLYVLVPVKDGKTTSTSTSLN